MQEPTAPLATLGLVGDGDDSDVIRDLEHAFGVDFGRRPASWTTMGDVEGDLLTLYPAASAPGLCGSAMAFRSVRRTIASDRRARPDTPLASLIPIGAAHRIDRTFQRSGLHVPVSRGGPAALVGILLALAGLLGAAPALVVGYGWLAVALIAIGVGLVGLDRRQPAEGTLGTLARTTAARNFAHFATQGADRRRAAIWRALCEIVAQEAGIDPRRIGRETQLLG